MIATPLKYALPLVLATSVASAKEVCEKVPMTYYEVPNRSAGADIVSYLFGGQPKLLGKRVTKMVTKCYDMPDDNQCEYVHDVKSKHIKQLERVKIDRRRIIRMDNGNKCAISLRGMIDGQWHTGNATYVYDTNVSEDYACDQAIARAKEKVYKQASPEVFTSELSKKCKVTQ